jgi:hypothetical protein
MKVKDQLLDVVSIASTNLTAFLISEPAVYGHVDGLVLLSFSCLGFALLIQFVQVVFLSLLVMLRVVTSEWSKINGWTRAGDPVGIDRFWGWHLRARCCPCVIECFASASMCTLHCKTRLYQNLNKNYNILYSEHLIYGMYVCTCVFLLHQESFNMILVSNPSFYEGVVTIPMGITSGAKWIARAYLELVTFLVGL